MMILENSGIIYDDSGGIWEIQVDMGGIWRFLNDSE